MHSRMGGLLSNVKRVLRTYNVEHRAHKTLSGDKKIVAPKHPSTVPLIEKIRTEFAEKYEELLRKNETLDKNLKKVYVKSFNETATLPRNTDLLPKRTRYESPFEYGYQDPKTVPPGKYTLTQIIQLLTDHHSDRELNTVEILAKEYNIDPAHLKLIVQHYKLFKLATRNDKVGTIVADKWSKKKETSWSEEQDLDFRNLSKLPSGLKKDNT